MMNKYKRENKRILNNICEAHINNTHVIRIISIVLCIVIVALSPIPMLNLLLNPEIIASRQVRIDSTSYVISSTVVTNDLETNIQYIISELPGENRYDDPISYIRFTED